MTYVCDTNAFVWATDGGRRLGREAARVLERAAQGHADVRLSVVSLWEIVLSSERGRLKFRRSWPEWLEAVSRLPGLRLEPLLAADVDEARALPSLVDPHDRLIVGTSLRLGAKLITSDERIARSGAVPIVW